MSFPLIVFPDAEGDAIDYLREQLDAASITATVGARSPVDRPDIFVQVRRVGGIHDDPHLDRARLQINVWHTSDVAAHDLAAYCRGLLRAARNWRNFRGHRDAGGLISAPDNGMPRYFFTVELTVKGDQ